MLGHLYLFMISIIAVGPSQCIIYSDAFIASFTLGSIGAILFILLLCIFIQCWKEGNTFTDMCRAITYCCNCLALVLLLGFIITSTVFLVYYAYNYNNPQNPTDCRFLATPFVTIALSYPFVILICCSWVLRCCIKLKGGSND